MIYLAAGNSRRFCESVESQLKKERDEMAVQRNKLLYEIDGKSMYRHLLERLERIVARHPGWELVVVSQYEEILKDIPELAIYCKDSAKGASYSIRAGVSEKLTKEQMPEAYAFFVADQPYFTEKTAEEFLLYMEENHAELGQVTCGGRVGNPTWFSAKYREELLSLTGDHGGRVILRKNPEKILEFEIRDERELKDIDILPKK